jgi:hypothetical protein
LEQIFKKKLTKSEVETRMIRLSKDSTKKLPKKTFEVTIGNLTLTKRIDKYNRIFLNVKDFAEEGDIITFSKKPNGSYQISFESA